MWQIFHTREGSKGNEGIWGGVEGWEMDVKLNEIGL